MDNKANTIDTKMKAVYKLRIGKGVLDLLSKRTMELVVNKKIYRTKCYTAKLLAAELGTNTRYVSAMMSECFGTNFVTFINELRIRDACEMLSDKSFRDLNIDDIADAVGFANRQSFFTAFKKYVGMTPRKYRVSNAK